MMTNLTTLLDEHGPAAIAGLGHNQPPCEPTPFDVAKKRLDDLVDEARLYCDGAKVETQELADDYSNLQRMIGEACATLEKLRKSDKAPLDKKIAEIQATYNPLISVNENSLGSGPRAIATLKAAQEPFLIAKAKAIADEAKRLADEAAEKQRLATEALRASSVDNLAEREAAEALLDDAKHAQAVASFAGKQTAKAGGAVGRATGLTTVYTAELIDPVLALRHFCRVQPARVREFVQVLANEAVRFGDHMADEIPGMLIKSEMKVR